MDLFKIAKFQLEAQECKIHLETFLRELKEKYHISIISMALSSSHGERIAQLLSDEDFEKYFEMFEMDIKKYREEYKKTICKKKL